eukprot:TRINITY_DN50345_c0_g1_i2.p1 TRINITY_DN50345_c0_g1~~TRINITY_DN50345_c0_g1_i2.p1  ORF type:complete len:213 (+),score=62.17 TRINITY_DN50345_c0_g1_i2:115-753(+)
MCIRDRALPISDLYPCPGASPLGLACKKNLNALVKLLLEHKAPVDANAVYHSMALQEQTIFEMLRNHQGMIVKSRNRDRSTVLHVACANTDEDKGLAMLERVFELCDEAKTDRSALLNSQTTKGVAPLAVACRVGNIPVIRILLAEGANAWAQDEDGNTALHHTENLMEGSDKVIELVCKKGGGEKLAEIENKAGNRPLLPTKMKMDDCKMQ